MTTTAQLRAIAVAALAGATNAGANVFSPLDWPTWSGDYPVLFVTTPDEDAEGLGRNGPPQFNVTATLRVVARVEQISQPSDQGAAVAYAALETLRDQIKVALINYPPLMSLLQQLPFYRTRMSVEAAGEQHLGEVVVDIGLEFYQGPEDFYAIPVVPLQGVDVTVQMPDGTTEPGLTINLPQD
jgi:hypothetical protein